jgi:predicted TIM-barrel fold metal-dependent hydrolase
MFKEQTSRRFKMKLIDIHLHVAPKGYLEKLEYFAQGGTEPAIVRKEGTTIKLYNNGSYQLPMNENLFSKDVTLAQMDKTGVQVTLISGAPDPGVLPAKRQTEACRLLNDQLSEIVKAHPDRFRGIGSLPWAVPDDAVKEAARIKDMGFLAVMLYSHCGPLQVDDVLMESTYQACQDLGLPVYLHPDIPLWYNYINSYNLVSSVGLVLDNSLALLRILKSGVFDRYPRLRLVMPHAGGVLPYLDGRLSYTPSPIRKFIPKDQKSLSEYLINENIWFDISNPSIHVLKMAREYLGANQMMFGSDFPYVEQDVLIGLLQQSGFTESELEGIYWKNAEKLFGKIL